LRVKTFLGPASNFCLHDFFAVQIYAIDQTGPNFVSLWSFALKIFCVLPNISITDL
jgi:hypothetical protein